MKGSTKCVKGIQSCEFEKIELKKEMFKTS